MSTSNSNWRTGNIDRRVNLAVTSELILGSTGEHLYDSSKGKPNGQGLGQSKPGMGGIPRQRGTDGTNDILESIINGKSHGLPGSNTSKGYGQSEEGAEFGAFKGGQNMRSNEFGGALGGGKGATENYTYSQQNSNKIGGNIDSNTFKVQRVRGVGLNSGGSSSTNIGAAGVTGGIGIGDFSRKDENGDIDFKTSVIKKEIDSLDQKLNFKNTNNGTQFELSSSSSNFNNNFNSSNAFKKYSGNLDSTNNTKNGGDFGSSTNSFLPQRKNEFPPDQSAFGKPSDQLAAFGKLQGFGKPQDQSAFGKPSDQSAFGKPQDQSAFGKPSDQSAFGKPQDQYAFGKPQDQSSFGKPQDQSAFSKPQLQPGLGKQLQTNSTNNGFDDINSFQSKENTNKNSLNNNISLRGRASIGNSQESASNTEAPKKSENELRKTNEFNQNGAKEFSTGTYDPSNILGGNKQNRMRSLGRNNNKSQNQHEDKPAQATGNKLLPDQQVQLEQFLCPEGCGRSFNKKALEKHIPVCKKVFQPKKTETNKNPAHIQSKEDKQAPKPPKAKKTNSKGAEGGQKNEALRKLKEQKKREIAEGEQHVEQQQSEGVINDQHDNDDFF